MPSVTQKRAEAYIYLRSILKAKRLKQIALCKPTGLTEDPINRRMSGKIQWSRAEMWKVLRFLRLPKEELPMLFPEDIYENPFEVAV